MGTVASVADLVARAIALALATFAGLTALTHWAVRNKRLNPFGPASKTMRSLSDPFLRPIETRIVRRGGNPQDATIWFLGLAVVLGLLLITLVRWSVELVYAIRALADASAATWLQLVIGWAFSILIAAIFIRFIGSWLGLGRHTRWMRPVFLLTDWLMEPIRRILPPMRMIDLTPFVAYIFLLLARALIFGIFFR